MVSNGPFRVYYQIAVIYFFELGLTPTYCQGCVKRIYIHTIIDMHASVSIDMIALKVILYFVFPEHIKFSTAVLVVLGLVGVQLSILFYLKNKIKCA